MPIVVIYRIAIASEKFEFAPNLNRVARARGKQEIWMFIFADRENTGNLPKKIKNLFLHWKFTSSTRKVFQVLQIKGCTKFVAGCFHGLLVFVVNFELVNWEMES